MALTYARFFPSDWRTGASYSLNLEEEGLYIRCCAYMWDTGTPVPGDDAEASRALHVHIHKYRKVMEGLITKGKMIRAQGVVFNERVVEELDRFRLQREENSARIKKGHVTRLTTKEKLDEISEQLTKMAAARDAAEAEVERLKEAATLGLTPQTTPQTTPPVVLGVTPPVTPPVEFKKVNDFNNRQLINHSSITDNPEARSQKPSITTDAHASVGNRIDNNFSAQAPKGAASKLEKQWRDATDRADKLRGRDPMDGSKGVKLENGVLKVVNGTRQALINEFPGVDIDGVCIKAQPSFMDRAKRNGGPTPELGLMVIRQYAQYDKEALAKASPRKPKGAEADDYSDLPTTLRQTLKNVSPERRDRIVAEFRGKQNA